MTVSMLERVLNSEVENLHIRVDEWTVWARSFDDRLSSVERQLGLLTLSVEELRVEMRTNYATKEDFSRFATKEDLAKFVTKEDAAEFATKKDLLSFATKKDLLRFPTKEDVVRFATKEDLAGLATKKDLKQYITVDTLEQVVKGAVDAAVEAVLLRFGLA